MLNLVPGLVCTFASQGPAEHLIFFVLVLAGPGPTGLLAGVRADPVASLLTARPLDRLNLSLSLAGPWPAQASYALVQALAGPEPSLLLANPSFLLAGPDPSSQEHASHCAGIVGLSSRANCW